jgi:hypothetical protein
MVKVLPVPVAPRRTWLRSPSRPPGEFRDGGRLVARRLEFGVHDEAAPAFKLVASAQVGGGGVKDRLVHG